METAVVVGFVVLLGGAIGWWGARAARPPERALPARYLRRGDPSL